MKRREGLIPALLKYRKALNQHNRQLKKQQLREVELKAQLEERAEQIARKKRIDRALESEKRSFLLGGR